MMIFGNRCLTCNKETSVLYASTPYCIKHWKAKYKESKNEYTAKRHT